MKRTPMLLGACFLFTAIVALPADFKVIANSKRQLADETFTGKAPAKVIESLRQKLSEYESQLSKTEATLMGLPE